MIPLSYLFWYGDGVRWGLRGDPHLWRDFRIAINYESEKIVLLHHLPKGL
jgi:hypothetical protein